MINITQIQILDSSLNPITYIQDPYPLSGSSLLQYSIELSDFGQCKFRVSSYDTLFETYGDIFQPHQNHIRLYRNGVIIWAGAIIENSKRTAEYIEIIGATYEWYLNKILVNRSSLDPGVIPTTANNNGYDNIYRIFNTVNSATTMAAAVTAIMNETITTFKGVSGVHPLANLQVGTIQNPNYPPNTTNAASPVAPLTGPFEFGDGTSAPAMTFDFHTILYILKSFANFTYADFQITPSLEFNFLSFLGNNNNTKVNFTWGEHGNAVDFNWPRLGQQMANDLIGIATDVSGNVLHAEQTDQASINTDGLIQSVAAYADIKDQATLNARVQAELPLISSPEFSPITFTLDEKAYPLGLYGIGDIVPVSVKHNFLTASATKRIIGISVSLGQAGREMTTVQLDNPLPFQVGN